MAEAIERKSTLAVKAESTYGTDPTIAAADVIEFVDFTLEPARGEIERAVIKNTFDELEPVFGAETVAGDITVELHGSGTGGTMPEADPLYTAAIGVKNTSTASTTVAGSTTTTLNTAVGEASNFAVGDMILIDPAGGTAYEAAWVTAVDTSSDQLTISPALSGAPASGRAITAGVHYKLSTAELKSLWVQFWRGDITLEKYKGCKVGSLAMDFTTGQIVTPVFSVEGQGTVAPATASYGLGTPTYDSGNVHVARYMAVKIGGTSYAVSNVSFNIANELFRVEAVTTSGTTNILRVKRSVTGSFSIIYSDKTIEDAFRAGTTAEMIIVSSQGDTNLTAGNTFGVRFPKIKYSAVPKSKDSGIYKYDVTFRAIMTSGEDSLSSLSFC